MRMAAACATALALAAPLPATAAQFLYTVTGSIIGDELSFDEYGLFDVVQGGPFTVKFLVDDGRPNASYTDTPTGSSASGGGVATSTTAPPVTATLTIGSGSYTIRTGRYQVDPIYDPNSGTYIGPTASAQDFGAVTKDANAHRLAFSSYYGESSECCLPWVYTSSGSGEELEFTLLSGLFSNPDYRQLGTFAVSGGGYFNRSNTIDGQLGQHAQIAFNATGLTVSQVSAVPEIGTWLMLVLGVGVVGAATRRRPAESAVAGAA